MIQTIYESNGSEGFREYLASSMNNMFTLDLSNYTLIECIRKMCEIKSRSHPNITKQHNQSDMQQM